MLKIFPSVQERIETMNDLFGQVQFLIDEPFIVDKEDWESVNSEEAQKYLDAIRNKFIALDDFDLNIIEDTMRATLEELDIKTKVGFQSARVAVTGTKLVHHCLSQYLHLVKRQLLPDWQKVSKNYNN